MKLRALVAAGALSVIMLACRGESWRAEPPPAPTLIEAELPYVERAETEGPSVFVVRTPNAGTVHVELVLRGGYADDPADQRGITRMLGRALLEGTGGGNRRTLYDRFGDLGAEPSVSLDDDGIGIAVQVRPEHAEAAAMLLGETLASPTLDPLAFSRVRREADETLRFVAEDPNALATLALGHAILDVDSPTDIEGLGRASSIGAITVEDVRARLFRLLVPERAALICVGPVTVDDARDWAHKATASWPRPSTARRNRIRPRELGPRAFVDFVEVPGLSQAVITVGGVLRGLDDPREPAQAVARDLAGGIVQHEIRTKQQLSYGVIPVEISTAGGGAFGLSAKVSPDASRRAVEAMFAAFDQIREGGLGGESIQQARRAQVVRAMAAGQSFDVTAHAIREAFERGAPASAADERLERMIALRDGDADAVFAQDFDTKKLRLVVVGPAEAIVPFADGRYGRIRKFTPAQLAGLDAPTPPPTRPPPPDAAPSDAAAPPSGSTE